MILACLPIDITAVEWPIQEYVIFSYEVLKIGVLIGSSLYNY